MPTIAYMFLLTCTTLDQITLVETGNTANFGMHINFQISKDTSIGLLC